MIDFLNTLEGFSPSFYFVFGLICLVIEAFTISFFILWFGVAAIILSILGMFLELNLSYQLTIYSILTISLVSLNFLYFKLNKNKNNFEDYFLHNKQSSIGIFKNNMIEYKGTFWNYEFVSNNEKNKLIENEKVFIEDIKNNLLFIKKI